MTATAALVALVLSVGAASACAAAATAGSPARTEAVTRAHATAVRRLAAGAPVTYTVRPGDSLTAIAQRFGTTLAALARANRLDAARPLLAGVTLRLPVPWCPAVRLTVQAGDTLWAVAAKYGIARGRLAQANGLKPDALLALGRALKVPARPCAQPPAGGPVSRGDSGGASVGAGLVAAASTTPARPAPAAQAAAGPALSRTALRVLQGKLAAAIGDPALDPALVGVAVVDLRSGQAVYAHNADTPLRPASTEKLPLLVAALKLLGPGFRTHTDVLAAAPVAGGVLRGDIVLKGYGDPRLSGESVARLASIVRSLGITEVTGGVVADESAFDTQRAAPGWKPSFVGEESPPLSALVVDGLSGPGGPAAAAAAILTKELRSAGVAVDGAPRVGTAAAGSRVLASLEGPPLSELAAAMGTWSDNFVAETTLKLLGLRIAGAGTSAAGASVVMRRLSALGIPRAGTVVADGSGLSSLDRISARTQATLLGVAARDADIGPLLRASLAQGGVTGTLRHRLRTGAAAGIVEAKTGTTDQASALAGYVGDRYAFSVICNSGAVVDTSAAHALQDRVVETLAESTR